MTKKPCSECVFTIVERSRLDEIFEDGGNGSFTEGRRWVTAQEMKKNADHEGKSLLVLFADAAQVNEVLYYAPIEKIEVPFEGSTTTCTFTDLLPIPWPFHRSPLIKTDLLMLDGRPVSEGHIRPYVLCRTPEILLLSEEEIFTQIPPVEEVEELDDAMLDLDEELSEEDEGEDEENDECFLPSGTARITCYSLLQDTAFALPKSDDQKLADLRSTQTGEKAWDEETILLMHLALRSDFGVDVSEVELAQCITIGDLVTLVKSKATLA